MQFCSISKKYYGWQRLNLKTSRVITTTRVVQCTYAALNGDLCSVKHPEGVIAT